MGKRLEWEEKKCTYFQGVKDGDHIMTLLNPSVMGHSSISAFLSSSFVGISDDQ